VIIFFSQLATSVNTEEWIYITSVVKKTHGSIDALVNLRQKVGLLQDETAVALKKNVYENYHQFIETAKEISSILPPFTCTF